MSLNNNYKTISFDIFDTLITRQTATPNGIFKLIEDKLLSSKKYADIPFFVKDNFCILRSQGEAYLRRTKVTKDIQDITFDEIYEVIGYNNGLSLEHLTLCKELEIEIEFANIVGIEENIRRLKQYIKNRQKVVLISDMYLPEAVIRRFLVKIDSLFSSIPLFISSEYKKTKGTGDLYKIVETKLKLDKASWLHIGDNIKGDIEAANLFGIKTERFMLPPLNDYEKNILDKNDESYVQLSIGASRLSRLNHTDTPQYCLGASFGGPLFYPYVIWLLEQVQHRGIKRLYFVARDGYILKNMADIIIKEKQLKIQTKYIYGSRYAWRLASVSDDENIGETLLNSIEIKNIDDLADITHQDKSVLNELFVNSSIDTINTGIAKVLLQNNKLKKLVSKTALNERKLICDYLKQEIDFSDDNFCFVEFKGTGKTQDCLNKIIRTFYNKDITSFYMMLDAELFNQKSPKFVFMPNRDYSHYILEIFLRAPHGQTIGYQKFNNEIIPLLDDIEPQAYDSWGYNEYIQGVEDYTRAFLNVDIENFSKPILFENYFHYMSKSPSKEFADIVGTIPYTLKTNVKNICEAAPILRKCDVNDVKKPTKPTVKYEGSFFNWSLIRTKNFKTNCYEYKENEPDVSVILPIYNVEKFLRQCLDSVVSQTLKNIEIICVDDGSTDNSLNILKEYMEKDKRIIILQQENKGAGVARNAGLAIARGKYLSFLDSDDFFELDMLQTLYENAENNNADIIVHDVYLYDNETKETSLPTWIFKQEQLPQKVVFNYIDIPNYIFSFSHTAAWNKLFKHSFISHESIKFQPLSNSNDFYFVCLALVLAKRISIVNKRLLYYRTNNKQSLSNKKERKLNPENGYTAINALRSKLRGIGIYESLEQSVIDRLMSIYYYNSHLGDDDLKNYIYSRFKTQWLKEFNLESRKASFFYRSVYYEMLQEIKNMAVSNNRFDTKIKIAIHGSCCSREIFNSSLNTFELVSFLFQNPFHTMFEKPFSIEIEEEELLTDSISDSKFMRRMVANEFNKKALQILNNNPADYLMIDVVDLRLGRFNVCFNNGEKTKILETNETTKKIQQLKEQLKSFDFTPESSMNISEEEWDCLIDKYVTELKKIYPVNKIILNRIAIATQYEKDGALVNFTEKTGGAPFRNKNLLLKLQNKLEEKLDGCLILDNPPFPIIADPNHKLGLMSAHLKQNVYDWKMKKLQDILLKKPKPKVSVIMSCYNTAPFLRQALDSVINQTLKEIEIICVNDGSTDNTLDIIKEYAAKDKRIVVIDGPNGGYGKAMNKGLDAATGEYIGILEPDDYLKLDMYETQYKVAKENNLDFVKADFYRFVNDDYNYNHLSKNPKDYNIVCKPIEKLETFLFIMNTWSGIYRREFIEKFNIRHNETPGASFQDNGFFFQTFCFAERAMFLDKPFYMNRRDNPNSSVKSKGKVYCMNEEYRYIKELFLKNKMFNKVKEVYEILKFRNYMFTLTRIDDSFKWQYVLDISNEFRNDLAEFKLDYTFFNQRDEEKRKLLMISPADFYNKYVAKNENQKIVVPKVSVIIPVYNTEEYLRQCLDSVINQTLKEIEIICVDDGSMDNSLKILKEYAAKDKRMTVITQENLYAGVARNAGLAVAKGEYVHFLDSDDWVDLDTYEELYYLIKEKKTNFMKFRSFTYDNKEKKIINHAYTDIAWITEDQVISIDKNLNWAIKMSDAPWSGFYNLAFLNENNIRFNNLKCANDVSFFINCLIKSRAFYFSTKRFVYYRRNNDKSLLGIRPFNFNCQIETYHIINKIAENEPPIIKQALKDRYSASILSWCKQYMEDSRLNINTKSNIYNLTKTFFDQNQDLKCRSDFNFVISPLLFKDIGLGCNTWCEPRNVNGCSYTYDLSDNIYTRYVSWDPIKEGSCDVEIMRLSAVEKRSKKVVEFPINKIVSSGKIVGNKVAFRNQKSCWIGCTVEGAYESFTVEAKITNS